MSVSQATASGRERRSHLRQVDLIRILPMVGVVAVHSIIFTEPDSSVGVNGLLMVLHTNREIFFFVTAFVLFYATGAAGAGVPVRGFWRRRYSLIVAPYLAWTAIYWLQTGGAPWPADQALRQLGTDLAFGWFHLYFLLVTMQLYALFPLLAWLIRRTRGHHWQLLGVSAALQIGFTALIQYWWAWIPAAATPWFENAQVEVTSYQFYFVLGGVIAAHLHDCLAWGRRHRRLVLAGSAALACLGEAWYGWNLTWQRPDEAAGVFQPAGLLMVLGVVGGLFLLSEHLASTYSPGGRLWRAIGVGARSSFGVYLSHMLPLYLLLMTPAASILALNQLPAPAVTVVTMAVVLSGTIGLVLLLQRTPFSKLLTGRPRQPRQERSTARHPVVTAGATGE